MLTALAVALPAQAGLMVIGGEGALVSGPWVAPACHLFRPPANTVGSVMVVLAGALFGAACVWLAGWLRQWRGVNETISSLLLAYIAIALFKHFVEGPMRDRRASTNPRPTRWLKACASGPSWVTRRWSPWLGDVHWGLCDRHRAVCCAARG